MKRKILVSIACILGLGVATLFVLPPPIEGYYRSDGATLLDSESTGYLFLQGGKIEIVNFRASGRHVHPFGVYTAEGRLISVCDQVNSNEFTGRAYLWGIHWDEYGGLDRFTRRAFPE